MRELVVFVFLEIVVALSWAGWGFLETCVRVMRIGGFDTGPRLVTHAVDD